MWNWLQNKVRTAREIRFTDLPLMAEAWWSLLFFFLRLRLTSFDQLTKDKISIQLEPIEAVSTAHNLYRIIGLASKLHLLKMTCLIQSLTLRWMLMQRGIPSDVRIGAMMTRDGFHAHAWVEIDGQVIGDAEVAGRGFKPLESAD